MASLGVKDVARALSAPDPWWPWLSRFYWSPARDLHPTRRAALLPQWPEHAWSEAAVLRHVSKHLLRHEISPDGLSVDVGTKVAERLPLISQAPLSILAQRLGLLLGDLDIAHTVTDADEEFVTSRAPLYWRHPRLRGFPPTEELGWSALRLAIGAQPPAVQVRFEWKTPMSNAGATLIPEIDPTALRALSLRIIKELNEPWPSLFATSQI